MRAEAAFLRFHLRVGARLALRVLAPALATILFLFYVLRLEFALALARGLFVEGSLVESGLVGTLLLFGLARAVTPRIAAGQAGWARSLPAGGRALRALETLSAVVAETPLLAVMGALAWAVAGPSPERIAVRLAGLVVGAAAASLFYLRGSPSLVSMLAPIAACFLSFAGNGAVLLVAAATLALATAAPGSGRGRRRPRHRRGIPASLFFYFISVRAVGARVLLAYVPPAIVLAASRLLLANNELGAKTATALSLFGLTLGLAVFVGLEANVLAARRPAWPWLRSLPRSAAARVGSDALFLGLNALPLALGLVLLGRPAWDLALLAGPLAWLALRGAGAVREAADRPFGPMGQVLVEGAIISLGVAVLPWLAAILLLASPLAFGLARGAERRLKPSLWAERHHLNAGDPLSWSAS